LVSCLAAIAVGAIKNNADLMGIDVEELLADLGRKANLP